MEKELENKNKIILHLCAKTGSDSFPYKQNGYSVIIVDEQMDVRKYNPPEDVYGIIANPPCTEFSTARANGRARNPEEGFALVWECLRIINASSPKWYVIENPAKGVLKKYLGDPKYSYEPWWYGSGWTKKTALWGKFNIPPRTVNRWEDCPKIEGLIYQARTR